MLPSHPQTNGLFLKLKVPNPESPSHVSFLYPVPSQQQCSVKLHCAKTADAIRVGVVVDMLSRSLYHCFVYQLCGAFLSTFPSRLSSEAKNPASLAKLNPQEAGPPGVERVWCGSSICNTIILAKSKRSPPSTPTTDFCAAGCWLAPTQNELMSHHTYHGGCGALLHGRVNVKCRQVCSALKLSLARGCVPVPLPSPPSPMRLVFSCFGVFVEARCRAHFDISLVIAYFALHRAHFLWFFFTPLVACI
uniref:Uncharacterized protein n=1 Tax=Panagrellus redivivus TaxID=6233 RepID=A0A7E4WD53_PANRE